MPIDRFSRGPIPADVQSEFMPLPLDIIDRQIQRRQTQYDKAKATIGASQEALYGAKGLTPDREALSNIIGGYDKYIEEEVSKVGGDYSRLAGISDALSNKVSMDLKSGHLGAIHNNFIKAQNHMKDVGKSRKDGKISEAGYNKALSSISTFGGTVEDGNGGYIKAALYQPTKALELGELGDTYGKTVHDQYLSTGERYLNASKASEFIFKNLYNNPQARENAKEQVWSVYGDLDKENESIAVRAYLKNIASASGNKLAFRQKFKPSADRDNLTGGVVITSDIIAPKPEFGRIKVGNETLESKLGKITQAKLGKQVEASIRTSLLKPQLQGQPVSAEHTRQAIEALNTVDEEVRSVYKDLADNDFVNDVARLSGIDLNVKENRTSENLEKISKWLKAKNAKTSSTRLSLALNEDTQEVFERELNPIHFKRFNIIDVNTGNKLLPEDKESILVGNLEADDSGTGKVAFGGEVLTEDQYYPPGTKFFGVYGGGEYAIVPSTVNSKEFLRNKYIVAFNNGYSDYIEGGSNVQLIKESDATIKEYKDGKYTRTLNLAK